mmetsp:Transcript_9321/g.21007  ORF Transcript_9321/g.21007 Transcript_9321/m.21007 type:complete len:267 (+) Transcript_9321:288-1088(+)
MSSCTTKQCHLPKRLGKVLEEELFVFRIHLDVLQEALVFLQCNIRRQHHELAGRIRILEGSIPFTRLPLQVQQHLEIFIVKLVRVGCPGSIKATAILVAGSESMGATQGNDGLIIKTHAIKHVTQVLCSLRSVGKSSLCRASGLIGGIRATIFEWNVRSSRELDSLNTRQNPKVGRRKFGMLFFEGLQNILSNVETSIGWVTQLFLESHCGSIRSTTLVVALVKGAGVVPSQTNGNRAGVAFVIDDCAAHFITESLVLHGLLELAQ